MKHTTLGKTAGGSMLAMAIAVLLSACNSMPERDPAYAGARPVSPAANAEVTGSLYHASTGIVLYEDPRARRIGDILIVKLVENTNATKSASTNTKKQNSVDIGVPLLFGKSVEFDAPRRAPLNDTRNLTLSAALDSNQDFKGDAGSSQKNSLFGSVSVTVTEVLTNGNLLVRGEKLIGINQGHEYVRLSGIVRAQDIQPDNSVLSTQVADAQISYGGKGAVADSSGHGWLTRFFLSSWWPF
ncbi:MAG TPA: flagellar basal body L-ring protein FlgH [Acidiferrobacterales bacterium]|nr:flagellar basal body L-ring protein FlgH [Acidiferrobacterales bacterium]